MSGFIWNTTSRRDLRETGEKGLREIGAVLGVKSPAVRLAIRRVKERMTKDRRFRKRIETAKEEAVKGSKP